MITTVTVALSSGQGAVPATVYTYAPASIVAGSIMPPLTAEGPLHVPPASGVPPSCAKSEAGASLLQSVIVPSVPGSGGVLITTVTVALSSGQGAVPATVYVYAPASIVAGSIMPPTTAEGPLHVPPALGVPPSCAKSEAGASLLQSVIVPSVPGSGGVLITTVSSAIAFGQGEIPDTV